MKSICVSMSLKEEVLFSYLARVFKGEQIEKKTCKVVRFPENKIQEKGWNTKMFKNFCEAVASNKDSLKMYRAKLTRRETK